MYLRTLRHQRSLRLHEVATQIDAPSSTISRTERGLARHPHEVVNRLLHSYNVTPLRSASVRGLLRSALSSSFVDTAPGWCERLVACERQARTRRVYSGRLIPAVLRVPAYAAALPAPPLDNGDQAAVATRSLRPGPERHLTVILHEGALRPVTNAPQVMAEQLAHLERVGSQRGVDLRIVPAASRVSAGLPQDGVLTELVFPGSRYALYVIEDGYPYPRYLIDSRRALLDDAQQAAASAQRSRILLHQARVQVEGRCTPSGASIRTGLASSAHPTDTSAHGPRGGSSGFYVRTASCQDAARQRRTGGGGGP
ncbi:MULTISPECIES: Scr1 family TA system antitoxin-like transcriptional regulator [Streptomyces]|uniref:Scr1 family TA system antitoxin-like transcriptional regulator n=1 Tax=Streptomyces TaxID=1883 RepID=UPI00131B770E|nr:MULTISPECIES: Scr1 family TA system antitoxin-like transcriptional regulator [Streptomyces]